LAAQHDNRIRLYGKLTKLRDNSIVLLECNEYKQSNGIDCDNLSQTISESFTNEIIIPKISAKSTQISTRE
jgi:hypothetical protein